MKNLVLVAVAAAAALSVCGCDLFGKDPDFYPTTVGSEWRYEGEMVWSQPTAGTDTVWTQVTNLRVTGTAALGVGGNAAVFVSTDSMVQRMPMETLVVTVDTSWVLKNGDWVLDFDGPNDDRPDTMLALPLEQSKTWQVFGRGDTTVWATVVGKSDITVPAGTFKACWEVEYEYSQPGGNYKFSQWYAEGVGWVKGRSRFVAGNATVTMEQRLTRQAVK